MIGRALAKLRRRSPRDYDAQKALAQNGNTTERLRLAANTATAPEILYYLAQNDPEPQVRLAVARNPSTPAQASALLAVDKSIDVRLALAEQMARLLPALDPDRQAQLYAFAVQALGALALDEVLRIRKALSSALKDCASTPPNIAAQLARDIQREVAEPILRFCAALRDEDMLEILKEYPAEWVAEAIAARPQVNDSVSAAVIATGQRAAGFILIGNRGAMIPDSIMEEIIARSRQYVDWQAKIAVRPHLSAQAARRLAEFADASVRDLLAARTDLDSENKIEIAAMFRRRLGYEGGDAKSHIAQLKRDGKLDEDAIADALGMKDRAFVIAALTALAGVDDALPEKIFTLKAAKPIAALCWKAGLSMRLALRLQQELGQVPHQELLYPRGGTDYPLSDDELKEQLKFLGL